MTRWETQRHNKYGNDPCWSKLIRRGFHSKLERDRAETLHLMAMAGEILDLKYQVPIVLCDIPGYHCEIVIDFSYLLPRGDTIVYEDTKGFTTKEARVKLCWLYDKFKIKVNIIKKGGEYN